MNIYKKAYVKMLPTNDMGAPICRYVESKKLEFRSSLLAYHTNQHVYLLSEERIVDGDNFIVGDRVVKAITRDGSLGYDSFNEVAFLWIQPHHKKIISTTDRTLTYKNYLFPGVVGRYFENKHYAPPTDIFLQELCAVDGDISEVLVEYEKVICSQCHDHCGNPVSECSKYTLFPSTDENGDIIIKPNKTLWTREEVEHLRDEAFYKGVDYGNDEIEDDFNRDKFINDF